MLLDELVLSLSVDFEASVVMPALFLASALGELGLGGSLLCCMLVGARAKVETSRVMLGGRGVESNTSMCKGERERGLKGKVSSQQ